MIWLTVIAAAGLSAVDLARGEELMATIEVCAMLVLMALAIINDSIRGRS